MLTAFAHDIAWHYALMFFTAPGRYTAVVKEDTATMGNDARITVRVSVRHGRAPAQVVTVSMHSNLGYVDPWKRATRKVTDADIAADVKVALA